MTTPKLKPVGQRPRCLFCNRELRPRFKTEHPPFSVATGKMLRVRNPFSFGKEPEYEGKAELRSLTDSERKQWRKEHPPIFRGYGGYADNRFCGLNCGYTWALHHSPEAE